MLEFRMPVRPHVALVFAAAMVPVLAHAQVRTGKLAEAKPGEFRIFAGTSMRGPLEAALPAWQRKIGKPILVEYGAVRGILHDEILAGQAFDIAILLPDTDQELVQQGKLMPPTYPIAQAPIALGLRGAAPAGLDVSTPAGLKTLLLGARSVKYTPTGAAITTVKILFAGLQIGDKVKDTSAQSGDVALGPGEYEIAFYPFPEIAGNKALRNLGTVIAPFQMPAIFEAAVGSQARDQKEAFDLIAVLRGPEMDAGLKQSGLVKAQ
jgi:ABC-type molybdate transport system substrate-binding protein